jgi:hypothetical protein
MRGLLAGCDFWSLAPDDDRYIEKADGSVTVCLDGVEYTIEAWQDGAYHVVDRYCPDSESYRTAALYLLKLSGIRVNRQFV